MRPILIYLFLFQVLIVSRLSSQDILVDIEHYGIEEGLSHRDVQCAVQDDMGFMWFGTKYGLNRFDGYDFKWYTKEKNGLQSNEVNHIVKDERGLLWLFNTGIFFSSDVVSIDIIDPFTETVLPFEQYFKDELPFLAHEISCFTSGNNGQFAFLTNDNKLFNYSSGKFRFVPFSIEEGFRSWKMHFGQNGQILLIQLKTNPIDKGILMRLSVLDSEGKEIHRFDHPGTYGTVVYDVDKQGNFSYIVSNAKGSAQYRVDSFGVSMLDLKSNKVLKREGLGDDDIRVVFIEKYGKYFWWVGDPKLTVFSLDENIKAFPNEKIAHINGLTRIYQCSQGLVWICSQFGIHKVTIKESPFIRMLQDVETKLNPVRGIEMDESKNLWVVRENGRFLWNIPFQGFNTNPYSDDSNLLMGDGGKMIAGGAHSLLLKRDGVFEMIRKNTVTNLDPATLTFSKRKTGSVFDEDASIWAMYEDEEGSIWYALDNGQIKWYDEGNSGTAHQFDNKGGLFYSYHFFEAADGKTWLATQGGLYILDTKQKKTVGQYSPEGEGEYFLPVDDIRHIHQDADSTFWLSTGGSGILHWSPTTGKYAQFTKVDGLSNNTVHATYEDEFGYLWCSTDYGISRFEKSTGQFWTFLEKDGVTHNEFNRISHFQSKDGTLFFGGLNGVTAFHPKNFLTDTSRFQPPLVITEFQQFDGETEELTDRTTELRETGVIRVKPSDRFYRLGFALLAYGDLSAIQYAYRIEGVVDEWSYQNENILRFSRFPYGEYLLEIKGQTPQGHWSQKTLAIKVIIERPFYLEWSFLAFVGILLIVSGPVFHKYRMSQLQKRQFELETIVVERTRQIQSDKLTIEKQSEELKSLEQLKSRFFANVSHELRTPLSLMLGPLNSLLKRKDESSDEVKLLEFVQRNAQQLQKLVNEILDLSKLEDNKLAVVEEQVDLHGYLNEQASQFYSAASSGSLNFRLDYKLSSNLIVLIDKNKFQKIIHNYLSNALKYSPPNGKIDMIIKAAGKDILICIADEGRGIHANDLPYIFDRFYQSNQKDAQTEGGTGIGLSLVKELAQLLGGKVWVESKYGEGSKFYFQFPKKEVPLASSVEAPLMPENEKGSVEVLTMKKEDAKPIIHAHLGEHSILVVEDNQDLREYLKFLLSGYQVVAAENGKAALDLLTNTENPFKPDLIISDLMMPVMDGFEFLDRVKSDDRWRHLPFIMLTAKVNIRAKLKALRIGVDDYLTKPFQEEELLVRIDNLLRNYLERRKVLDDESMTDENPTEIQANSPQMNASDSDWLAEIEKIFSEVIGDSRLSISYVATLAGMSDRQFYRRLKSLTGLTPNNYLREIRLQFGKDLIVDGKYSTVKEVAAAVGFHDVPYFSKLFEQRFGNKPSEFGE